MPRHVPDHFFGHPRPLSTLFHIELWERFSYYGMQSILLIYLYYEVTRGGLGIDQGLAGGIVGIYGGSVYLATILGGWLADRVLGAERTLFYSGIVVMLGHIALALVPGVPGLVVGLVCIALGSGGVKSSASSMVGALYEDPQWHALRDAGFSIFYLAVNIGGFFGPLLTGVLQSEMGFHYGFGAAALGMAFGLWRYARGRAGLPQLPVPNPLGACCWGPVSRPARSGTCWPMYRFSWQPACSGCCGSRCSRRWWCTLTRRWCAASGTGRPPCPGRPRPRACG